MYYFWLGKEAELYNDYVYVYVVDRAKYIADYKAWLRRGYMEKWSGDFG